MTSTAIALSRSKGDDVDEVTNLPDFGNSSMPAHVAIIMDGNGRWANLRGLRRNAGHEAGEQALLTAVETALEVGVSHLTVYAFSTENWRRPADEVEFLMGFNESLLLRRVDELDAQDVNVRFIGRRCAPVPERLIDLMHDSERRTADNSSLTLRVAFNYGGRAEIVDAALAWAASHSETAGADRHIDDAEFAAGMYDPSMPDVDLLIRTSGEMRLSNFLLWQAAYAELVFTETLWPDFDRDEFLRCLGEYQQRARRFGDARDAPITDQA